MLYKFALNITSYLFFLSIYHEEENSHLKDYAQFMQIKWCL